VSTVSLCCQVLAESAASLIFRNTRNSNGVRLARLALSGQPKFHQSARGFPGLFPDEQAFLALLGLIGVYPVL